MVNEVIVILAIVERVEGEAVEESTFVLSLSNNEWNFGEFALHQKVFWCVRKDVSINIWSKPPRERKEHSHGVCSFNDVLLSLSAQTIDNVFALFRGAFQPV